MNKATAHPVRTVADLELGDHPCCLYEAGKPHKVFMRSFLREGLDRGEKILYIADSSSPEAILSSMREDRRTIEGLMKEGRVEIMTARDTYLRSGVFDPEDMISLLRSKIKQALAEGFIGLRVSSEMTWVLQKHPGSQHMVEFESRLDAFLKGKDCLFLCQYDQRQFGPIVLLYVMATHPIAIVGGEVYENFYYMPSPELLGKRGIPSATLHTWLGNLTIRKQAMTA